MLLVEECCNRGSLTLDVPLCECPTTTHLPRDYRCVNSFSKLWGKLSKELAIIALSQFVGTVFQYETDPTFFAYKHALSVGWC